MDFLSFFDIVLYSGEITIMNVLGLATVFLAMCAFVVYCFIIYLWRQSHHGLTKALKRKFIVDAGVYITTALMGAGAMLDVGRDFWGYVSALRLVLLALAIVVLINVFTITKDAIHKAISEES